MAVGVEVPPLTPRRSDARPAREGPPSRGRTRRRPARLGRRRFHHWLSQGRCDDHAPADHRGTDYLCTSEATTSGGLTEATRKTAGIDDGVLPVTVMHDAVLSLMYAHAPGPRHWPTAVGFSWPTRHRPVDSQREQKRAQRFHRAAALGARGFDVVPEWPACRALDIRKFRSAGQASPLSREVLVCGPRTRKLPGAL